jgi:sensor c-di-GMP phosphodiesterase-like protein
MTRAKNNHSLNFSILSHLKKTGHVDPQDKTLVAALQHVKQAQKEAEQRKVAALQQAKQALKEAEERKVAALQAQRGAEQRKVEEEKRSVENTRRRPPSGLTIASLTSNVRNSSVFPEYHHTFSQGFESVWIAVHRVLQEGGDQIARSNQQSGVIITNLTSHRDGIFPRYLQYYILVEEAATGSTKVSFKLFTYFESLTKRGTLNPSRDVSAFAKQFVTKIENVLGQGR